jgi:hypothetical protein
VAAEIVEDDDIAALESGDEDALDRRGQFSAAR